MSTAPYTSTPRHPGAASCILISLLVIATAQLMLVLDDSIANIALPTIQNELGISAAHLPWVINAYILAFGGLLLFGGRMGDLFGRRRLLQAGMVIFTVASLLASLADSGAWLIATRRSTKAASAPSASKSVRHCSPMRAASRFFAGSLVTTQKRQGCRLWAEAAHIAASSSAANTSGAIGRSA